MNNYILSENNSIIIVMSLGLTYILYEKYKSKCILLLLFLPILLVSNNVNSNINKFNNSNTYNINNYTYNKILIEEETLELLKKAKNNPQLKKNIRSKSVEAYQIINTNPELRNYFIFNNLIDSEGLPIFINNMPDELLLYNEIKIILVLSKIL